MAAGRLSLSQYMPARDRLGRLVSGARMRVWQNRTTTNAAVFADAGLTTPLTNPVVANSSGQFPAVWVEGGTPDDPILFTLAFSAADGTSIGNPSVFDDVQTAVVYDFIEAVTTSFTRSLLTTSTAAAFRLAIGAQSRIVIDVTDAPYFAAFDGVTNDLPALQAAANAAAIVSATLVMPGRSAFLAGSTLLIPSNVGLEGKGRTVTRLFKTGIYGAMIQFGTASAPWQGGRVSSFWAYHDYGTGPFPPNDPSLVTHPSGPEAILDFFGPYNGTVDDVWANGGAQNIRVRGGVASTFSNVSTQGVNNPVAAGLQFSTSGLLIEKGSAGQVPTNLRFIGCAFGGVITAPPTPEAPNPITWPDPGGTGPHITTDVVRNIGALRTVQITCCESLAFIACYFGAGAKHNLAFNNVGDIISGVSASDCFMDASHEAQVAFEGSGTSTSINLNMREWVGQGNCYGAVTDKNFSGAGYSVAGLEISGLMRAFIGIPVYLDSARRWTINSDIRWWNMSGFYTPTAGYNCGIHVGSRGQDGVVRAPLGGDNAGEFDPHTVAGVFIEAGAININTDDAIDGGLAGPLVVGGFHNTGIRVDNANFSLRQRVNACYIEHLGTITANRTIALDLTGARDGDVWHVVRQSTGAFNLIVAGAVSATLTTPGQWVTFRYNADNNAARYYASGTLL